MASRNSLDTHSLVAELEAYMNACGRVEQFSGAVFVSWHGKQLLSRAYGMADIEHRVSNGTNTKFRLGSITKPMTVMSICMLEEMGELSISDPVSKFITDTPGHWNGITLRHLIDHSSGLPNFTALPNFADTTRLASTPWQTLDRVRDLPLVSAPGEQSSYNNSGYIALGAIIELVSGRSYADFLTEKIFAPLKMFDTGYDVSEQILENRARGYVRSKQAIVNASFIDMSVPFSAGALYSTVDDLFLFDQAIYKGKKPIPQAVKNLMHAGPHPDGFALGWHVDNSKGRCKVGHSGGIEGFCTMMAKYPDEKLTVLVLSNVVSWMYTPERIAEDLSSIVFGEPYEIPRIRKAIKLDSPTYDHYMGIYELEELNMQLRVTKEDGRWLLQFTDEEPFEIFPESENEFFVLDYEAQIKFCLNARKQVSHVFLVHGGQPTRAYKVR